MKVSRCPLAGVLLIEPDRFGDERGFFLESYNRRRYIAAGIAEEFQQDNHSRSVRNVLRGMHFTRSKPQSQVVTVIRGRIFDVVVDIRTDSPSRGKWFGTELSDTGVCQLYAPYGFAHGFYVLSDYADLHYKVSQSYDPTDEGGLRWNDPDVGIEWPVGDPIVSKRDREFPLLKDLDRFR
jgi:dTDP-4-dehydrorhamnose 3,5-epimerase